MLSLHRFREQLGPCCTKSGEELVVLRTQLYALAHAILAATRPSPCTTPPANRSREFLRLVPAGSDEFAQERAAIREYDGGQSRREAERGALAGLGITEGE